MAACSARRWFDGAAAPEERTGGPRRDHIAKHPKILRALAAQDENEAVGARYRFLLQLLLDNGALHQDESGIWALRGTCSVDESVPRGTGTSPEQAIDSAIKASKALEGG
ncbi:hypothetical protein AWV80_09025 [Cupriavidus sp. UYMU48A]|nr:hypothetical protein AWV80_09025 [Cupriavidus sp. UYMU48A]